MAELDGGAEFAPAEVESTTPESNAAPSGLDISDDTPVRGVPGYNEPVRYGDLYRRLEGGYTKKQQLLAKEKAALAAERQSWSESQASERRRLESLAQTLIQRQGGTSDGADPLFSEMVKAQYIDGPMMGKFINTIQEKGFAPIVKAFQERDTIIQGMYQQILQLNKTVNELHGNHSAQSFEGKIDKWLSDGGYPPEAKQLAKELYLAYEGDDLDDEFPNIFAERWSQLQTILRAQDRKRIDDAKRGVRLPGKGGTGTPSKGIGLKGNESPKQVTDALWEAMQAADQT